MILNQSLVNKTIDAALSTGADFAELFVEDTYSSQLTWFSQKPDNAVIGQHYGAGIRLFFGHEVIYVTTNDLSEQGLLKAAFKAAQSRGTEALRKTNNILQVKQFDKIHDFGVHPASYDKKNKMKWMESIDQFARSIDSRISQVNISMGEKYQKVQIANSLGISIYDERANSRIFVESQAEQFGKVESGVDNAGVMGTLDSLEKVDFKKIASESAHQALNLLNAEYAPAGEMPIVMDNAFGGVIFHEACGHSLETTQIQSGGSPFCGKLGEKIASDCVTAIDDGTIKNEWGSSHIDDEGSATQKTILIENGILKSYMADRMGSIKTGAQMTGSARRQSYKFAPASRMRNTFIAPGKDKFEDMIRDVDFGLYAKRLGGGSVGATGDFNFAVQEGYVIRNGKIAEIVKGACLIGKGPEVMKNIKMVSDDLKLAAGMCGSVSGLIPAGLGQPQVLVGKMTVGGRA